MSQAHRLAIYSRDDNTALAAKVVLLIPDAPVLRRSKARPDEAEVIQPVELSQIPSDEIVSLTHYSPVRGLNTIDDDGQCNWSSALGVSFEGIVRITNAQSPQDYRALYLIRVHAPDWPGACENIKQVTSGKVGKECMLQFTVAQDQFLEIHVKVGPNGNLLVPDP